MTDSVYLLDEYVSVTPGEPFRLFPFGRIVKGGEVREVTKELAGKFRLPHFKPPIKRGSHADDAPAGGFITGLEVRDDGLYAIPEFNEKGSQAVQDGDYRYHSPEVIWDEGPVFEKPDGSGFIHGPLIVGDALLHMPHLGEAAALFTVDPIQEGETMSDELTLIERFTAALEKFAGRIPEPEPQPEPEPITDLVEADVYGAVVEERDALQAKFDQMEAEAKKVERVQHFNAELEGVEVGEGMPELLAGLEGETADRIVQEFKALNAQIAEGAILDEKGTTGEGAPDNPVEALHQAILAKAEEAGVDYNSAREIVQTEQPDLFAAAYG